MIARERELGNSQNTLSPTPVVVRGAEGEPVRMEALSIGPRFVTVRRPGGDGTTVRLSYDIVYTYEPSYFRRLVKAFTRYDRETLEHLWQVTPRIK
jgi:hypothetical protein